MNALETFSPIYQLRDSLKGIIIGQDYLIERLIIALLASGHLLVEGPPGVAKTSIIKTLARLIGFSFHRIQFTPDLLPSDITGSEIYNPDSKSFQFFKGPIFNEIILADEINRSPSKVQSALLEAMEERQVSIGNETFILPDTFMVMATQNPIEQEGTYPLPEAQLDRFIMKVVVDYPTPENELKILEHFIIPTMTPIVDFSPSSLQRAQKLVDATYVDKTLLQYIVHLVDATRNPEKFCSEVVPFIKFGVSPRASISLLKSAKALARLQQRDYASPDDVRSLFADVCRHRLVLSFQARAQNITPDWICQKILKDVPLY